MWVCAHAKQRYDVYVCKMSVHDKLRRKVYVCMMWMHENHCDDVYVCIMNTNSVCVFYDKHEHKHGIYACTDAILHAHVTICMLSMAILICNLILIKHNGGTRNHVVVP